MEALQEIKQFCLDVPIFLPVFLIGILLTSLVGLMLLSWTTAFIASKFIKTSKKDNFPLY
jgi:ABC-type sulfate transport system permease component